MHTWKQKHLERCAWTINGYCIQEESFDRTLKIFNMDPYYYFVFYNIYLVLGWRKPKAEEICSSIMFCFGNDFSLFLAWWINTFMPIWRERVCEVPRTLHTHIPDPLSWSVRPWRFSDCSRNRLIGMKADVWVCLIQFVQEMKSCRGWFRPCEADTDGEKHCG